MNHYNPNTLDSNGFRQIASHFYPVTGPYDSDDTLVLEYQTLLMKISGIDGVLVKWDGMANYLDYGTNNISTQNTLKAIQKAKLHFGIVFEDYVYNTMINNGYMKADTVFTYGKRVMQYMQGTYFNADAYLKINNQPVLLNFGPQYFKQSANWDTLFSALSEKPMLFTEDTRLSPVATGAFPWTPMSRSDVNGILQQSVLDSYLAQYYQKAASWAHVVTTAFPGFHDIYNEAGVHNSYGFLDELNGATFKSTLYQATAHKPDIIQIETWNDYGEGTIIEPTVQFGTQYLEIIQATKDSMDASFPFQKSELQMPLRIYNARAKYASDVKTNKVLDRVYNFIIANQPVPAKTLLDSLLGTTSVTVEKNPPATYSLGQNYPNPFNPTTNINFVLSVAGRVTLKAYDVLGNQVAVLVDEDKPAGNYTKTFSGSNLSSGIYFYRLQTANHTITRKMSKLK